MMTSFAGTVAGSDGRNAYDEGGYRVASPKSDHLAGMTLGQLRAQYHYDLFGDFLPFMDQYVVDHRYGGFMCNTDRDGRHLSEKKESWFLGRGVWVYAYLYLHFGRNEKYLEVARQAVHFLMRVQPAGAHTLWPSVFSREGKPLAPPAKTIFGDLFIAEGFAEYAAATGEQRYWDLAKAITLKCLRIYNRPDYDPDVVAGYNDLMARYGTSLPVHLDPRIIAMYKGPKVIPFPGARTQAVSMVLIRNIAQMLQMQSDADLERIVDRCVEVVLHKHYNPEFDLNNELLNHDYSRPANELSQFVYAGHCVETLAILLEEGARTQDTQLFKTTEQRFRRHFEVARDEVYGGVFRSLNNVDNNDWSLDKVLWEQEEALNGLLFLVEQKNSPWARRAFGEMYTYVHAKYPLRQYGFPLWITSADRKVTFERHAARVENYHHPRFLMFGLLTLDRMLNRAKASSGSA